MAQNMGIGKIGSPEMIFKRKFRFTFEIQGFCNNASNRVPEYFVKTTGRPNLTIDETEINHLNGQFFIPGKGKWEELSVTYEDVAHDEMRPLWNWLATIHEFTDPIRLRQGNKRDYSATGILNLYDGCGSLLEQWQLQNIWPKSVKFGDLDYSSSDIAMIELTLRYQDVRFRSYCPNFVPENCCSGCPSPPSAVGDANNLNERLFGRGFQPLSAGTGTRIGLSSL